MHIRRLLQNLLRVPYLLHASLRGTPESKVSVICRVIRVVLAKLPAEEVDPAVRYDHCLWPKHPIDDLHIIIVVSLCLYRLQQLSKYMLIRGYDENLSRENCFRAADGVALGRVWHEPVGAGDGERGWREEEEMVEVLEEGAVAVDEDCAVVVGLVEGEELGVAVFPGFYAKRSVCDTSSSADTSN